MRQCKTWMGRAARAVVLGSLTAAVMAPSPGLAQASRTVTIVLSDEPQGLDGCNSPSSPIGRVVRQNIVESLTEIAPSDGSITPRLATSWQKIDDRTWRFKLREGVRFHDGAPFNAEAAAIAIERTMSTDSVSAPGGQAKTGLVCHTRTNFFGDLRIRGKAIDPLTLEITADKPVPILPTQMGVVSLSSPNTPKDRLVLHPIGTGPYVFDHWTAGQEIVVRRNDSYWGEKPQVEGARYIWRNEFSVRAAMVKLGEADMAPTISVQEATDPAMDFSYLNSETTWLRIDVSRPPLNDIRVRRAMNLAIDRTSLRGSLFPKDVLPATQIVVPSILGHNHDIDKKLWPYDPAKAKALLAEAKADGVPVDREITIIGRLNFYPNSEETLEAMTGMLGAVGLNVKVNVLEVAAWFGYNKKPFPEDRGPTLLQAMHDNNNGDPVFSVFSKYGCEGSNSTVCNPELDKLVAAASAASGEERVAAWREAFRIIYEDMISDIMLFHNVGYSRVGPRLTFKPSISMNSEIQLAQIKFK